MATTNRDIGDGINHEACDSLVRCPFPRRAPVDQSLKMTKSNRPIAIREKTPLVRLLRSRRRLLPGPRPALEPGGGAEHDGGDTILRLPSLRAVVRHALPALLESTIVPGALFYVVLLLDGFHGALIAALAWSLLALGRRLVRGRRCRPCSC